MQLFVALLFRFQTKSYQKGILSLVNLRALRAELDTGI
jgi:hypothetical protein